MLTLIIYILFKLIFNVYKLAPFTIIFIFFKLQWIIYNGSERGPFLKDLNVEMWNL